MGFRVSLGECTGWKLVAMLSVASKDWHLHPDKTHLPIEPNTPAFKNIEKDA